jgi:16S rRNA (guanine966-N2)-methyltransferase
MPLFLIVEACSFATHGSMSSHRSAYHVETMRIIAGAFRSRVLVAPKGMETRPTSDRLRETLFNVLGSRLGEARFLDLYAGSGANGLEALSRGAREVVLVEHAAPAVEAIRKNIVAMGVSGRARVEQVAVQRWLTNAARGGVPAFEVIFLDPPYDSVQEYTGTLGLLGGSASVLLAQHGVVVVEHRRPRAGRRLPAGALPVEPAPQYGEFQRFRLLEQGDAALSFYAFRVPSAP